MKYKKLIILLRCFISGCSAARLAHLVWDQRVAGSNPATPTKEKALHVSAGLYCLRQTRFYLRFGTNNKTRK